MRPLSSGVMFYLQEVHLKTGYPSTLYISKHDHTWYIPEEDICSYEHLKARIFITDEELITLILQVGPLRIRDEQTKHHR